MSSNVKPLPAVPRSSIGKSPEQVRRAGYIPAVVYGHNVATEHLAVERRTFEKLLPTISSSTLMTLTLREGLERRVLVHDIQRHPLSGVPIHVDLYQVNLAEKIRTQVPLTFIGTSFAVKDLGGTLVKSLNEITVEALPQDLPEQATVDISRLQAFDDRIRVADLGLPNEVTVLDRPDEVVATVTPPRTEEELKELETQVEEKAGEVKTEAEEKKAAEEAQAAEEAKTEGVPEKPEAKKEEKK
jgi:large subunit ribosomal protein L25